MSENLDLVRSIGEDWERGDYRSIEWAHPEIDFVVADGPAPDSAKGLAGMAAVYRRFLSTWEGFQYREIDSECVLVYVHDRGRGKTSGMEIGQIMGAQDGAILFIVRDGKVVKLVNYWDRKRALADLGLTE